jgi:hypothetical protein
VQQQSEDFLGNGKSLTFEPASEVGLVSGGTEERPLMRPIIIHGVELRLGVGKILAPFGETVKI